MGTIRIQVATEAEGLRKTQRGKGGQEAVRSRAEPRGMPVYRGQVEGLEMDRQQRRVGYHRRQGERKGMFSTDTEPNFTD